MKKTILLLIGGAFILLQSCNHNDVSTVEANITYPTELEPPQGAVFDYLLFENDYDIAPYGENPKDYTTEVLHSGKYSLMLTSQRVYGPGYEGTIKPMRPKSWLKISGDFFRKAGDADPMANQGNIVISYHRGVKDSTVFYINYPIQQLLKAQNKQLVEKWENLALWQEIPANVQPGDKIKIYPWNPNGDAIYIDNLKGEIWTQSPLKAPTNFTRSHLLVEQNYEDSNTPGYTKETASRGMASVILSANNSVFASGYQATLAEAKAATGDFIRVSCKALKHHKVSLSEPAALLVGSIRDESSFYFSRAIDPRIRTREGQVSQQWVTIEMWFEVPADANANDLLKVYGFNPHPTPIYLDDLQVEVWKANATN